MGFLANYVRNFAALTVGRQPARPLLFSYYITHRCPLDCTYCSDGSGRPFKEDVVEELSTDEACKLITLLRRSADTLDITGGEPLVREDLEAILTHARSIGFRTVLNTKGIGLRDRPEILQLADVLVLSVDSLQPDQLAAITRQSPSIAGDILETLHRAIANRSERRAHLVVATVATPENLQDVSDILRFTERNRLGFQLSPWIVGIAIHGELRDNKRFQALVDEVIAAKARRAGVLGVPQYLRGIRDLAPFKCHPLLMPTIRPNGTMYYPCLETGPTQVNVLALGGYEQALTAARERYGPLPACRDQCHLFCHMGLSLLQRHPFSALAELRSWGGTRC